MLNTMHSPNTVSVQMVEVKISPLTCNDVIEAEYTNSRVYISEDPKIICVISLHITPNQLVAHSADGFRNNIMNILVNCCNVWIFI